MSEKEIFKPLETKRKIITLDDLIDTSRTIPPEYERLIRAQEQDTEMRFQPTSYSDRWSTDSGLIETKKEQDWFAERLRGGVLIDLGGGKSSMRDFAINYGVSTYVCVDRFGYTRESPVDPLHPEQESDPAKTLHEIVIKADMLNFISRIKNRSANLTINGVDLYIIEDRPYHAALARELARVVKSGGIIFGSYSEAPEILARQLPKDLNKVEFPASGWYPHDFVFEKEK